MAMRFDPQTGEPITVPPVVPGGLTINVGDQGQPTATGTPDADQLNQLEAFLQAERERVRSEEKNKLYPKITELETTLGELTAEREARLEEERQRTEAAEAERARLEQEQMTVMERFEQNQRESEARMQELQARLDREQALREKEAEFTELVGYRARRLAEEAENIMPQFIDFVRGNTPEEIETSIADVKERTAVIVADVQAANGQQRRAVPLPVTGTPTAENLTGQSQERTYSVDDLREMTMDDYAANRSSLLGATSQRVREQGVYAP